MSIAARSTAIAVLFIAMTACQKKSDCLKNGVVVEVAGNHGHAAAIPADHIERGGGGMYPLRGGTHEHTMNLTDADVQSLRAGNPVTTRSTTVQGHVHEIGVTCKKN